MRSRLTVTVTGVAVIALAAAAAGCGSSSSGGSGSSSPKSMELIVGTKSDDFYVTMECGAEAEAKKLGVKLTVTGPASFSVPQQKPLIDSAEVTKPDALIVAPTDSAALDPDLLKVQKGGTKVIFVDTSSANTAIGLSRISSDNAQGGRLAADTLGNLIGGKGTVAVISVAKGVSTTDARVQGFQQEMAAKFPNVKLLPEQNDDADSVGTATSFIEGDMAANPDLAGAFAANVITAQGAASGIAHAGKTGKVKLATFDADPTQMSMMKAGTIQLAIAQEPALEGSDGVQQALNAVEGKPVTKNIATPLIAITPANMTSSTVKPYIYESSCAAG
ncbi:MAG TPA: ABC transporter substrate-binding protein [Streptosporangiaceae bacterium]|jgi:ABC-type sugar transport system substrate-binding protein|nr:ABC transporter substrate-binding protein [Streptosporangiaceae bacterium]